MKHKKFICIFFAVVLLTSATGAIVQAEDKQKDTSNDLIKGYVEIENKGTSYETSKVVVPTGVSWMGIKSLSFKEVYIDQNLRDLEGKQIEFQISEPSNPLLAIGKLIHGIGCRIRGVSPTVSLEKMKVVPEAATPSGDDDDGDDDGGDEKYMVEGYVSPVDATIEALPSNLLPCISFEPLIITADSNGYYKMEQKSSNTLSLRASKDGYASKIIEVKFDGTNCVRKDITLDLDINEAPEQQGVLDLSILGIEQIKNDDGEVNEIQVTVIIQNTGSSLLEVSPEALEYKITGPNGEVLNFASQSSDSNIELLSGEVVPTIKDIFDSSLEKGVEYEVTVSYAHDGETISDSSDFEIKDEDEPGISQDVIDGINSYGLVIQSLIAADMGYDQISAPVAAWLMQWNNAKLLEGSAGDTITDVKEGMQIDGIDTSTFMDTMTALRKEALNKQDDKITLEVYSEDWVNNAQEVLGQIHQEYLDALTDPNGAWGTDDIEYVPFYTEQQRNDVVDAINNYVKIATHDMFDKILEYDDLSFGPDPCCDQTHFALLNVQYVNAKIPQRRLFDEDSIEIKPFYHGPGKSGGSTSTEFMTFEGYDHGLNYIKVESDDGPSMQILEMKMEDEDHYLTFYQPTDGETLESILPAITNDNIKAWKSSSAFTNGMDIKIHFAVPKLDIMYDDPLDMIPYMEDAGMAGPGNPFVPETADLSGIYKKCGPCGCSDKPGCIGLVKFQCRMKLDEYGFEAAAAQDTDEVEAFVTLDEPFFMTFSADVPVDGSDDAQELILFMSTVCADGLA